MKALTLWRPWPWAIFHAPTNPKRIENRPWTPWPSIIGKQIVLHAGQTFDSEAADELCTMFALHPDGTPPHGWHDQGLIGVATVWGWANSAADCEKFMVGQRHWVSGPHAWLLSAVRTFREPIPCKGKQGLWNLSADVEARVREELNVVPLQEQP